jgi:putative intracellular protease/amidase
MPPPEEYLDFARAHSAAGAPILSVCTGAYVGAPAAECARAKSRYSSGGGIALGGGPGMSTISNLVDLGRPCEIHYIAHNANDTAKTTAQMSLQLTDSLCAVVLAVSFALWAM